MPMLPECRRKSKDEPAPTRTGNIYRVKLLGRIEEQVTQTVLHYQDTRTPETASILEMEELYQLLLEPNAPASLYPSVVSNDWQGEWILIDLPLQGNVATLRHGWVPIGSGGAGHAPTTISMTIARYTDHKGRCGRGRVSLPAVPLAQVAQSRVVDIMFFFPFSQSLILPLQGVDDSYIPGIYSEGTKVKPTVGFAKATHNILRDVLGTCRRRKLGRGI